MSMAGWIEWFRRSSVGDHLKLALLRSFWEGPGFTEFRSSGFRVQGFRKKCFAAGVRSEEPE